MTPWFSGSSIFTNILAILPILFLTLNQFIQKMSVTTVATLLAEFEAVVSTLNPQTLHARIWRQQDTLSAHFSCFIFGWPLV
jgi:hypothetical protein